MTAHTTVRPPATSHQKKRGVARGAARFCRTALVVLLAVASPVSAWPQAPPSVEYRVKAAFLLNFAKFIEWPPNAFPDDTSPITFCIFRFDPFGSALDEIIRGKNINNRALVARRVNDLPDLKTCQLVFVSEREELHLPEILNGLKGTSALLVGEGAKFAESGGGVQFFLENNRLRFAVNVDAVQRARLTISSKLLALARIVHDRNHQEGD